MPSAPLALVVCGVVLGAARTQAADPAAPPPPETQAAPLDVTGRLRLTGDGLLLEAGGARLELRASEAPLVEAPGPVDPRAHALRATIDIDGRTTHLLLRFVPAPGDGGAHAGEPLR
jgi:hypothetical protein